MTLESILEATRVELLDDPENTASPSDNLWSNAELIRHANSAEREVCKRTLALVDDETPHLAVINVVVADAAPVVATDYNVNTGTGYLTLSPLILNVLRVEFGGKILEKFTPAYLRSAYTNWKDRTGTPTGYVEENDRFRLFPKPTTGGALTLTVARLPLVDMVDLETLADPDALPTPIVYDAGDSPELPTHYHDGLKHWIAYLAYLKPDSQTLNKNAAAEQLGIFAGIYGPPVSVRDQIDRRNGLTTSVDLRGLNL